MPSLDPLQVLFRLKNKLNRDIPEMERYAKLVAGEFDPPWTPDKDVDAEFKALLERSKLPVLGQVIQSRVERLKIKGFRLSASSSEQADRESWDVWQANRLDREVKKAFREALTKGRCYVSVFYPNENVTGHDKPIIRVEDACQVYVEHDAGTQQRVAAIKVWTEDHDGVDVEYANVYLKNIIYKYSWVERFDVGGSKGEWVERDAVVEHDLGIPIIPLLNEADLHFNGRSEIEDVISSQMRINEMTFNRSLAGWFAAHQQKWLAGIDIPKDPETGEPNLEYLKEMSRRMVAGRPVVTEETDASFGTFNASDPNKYTEIINAEIQAIGEAKRIPRHYFLKEGSSVNGQSIKAAEAGLVAVVKDKMENFGESIEEVLVLARRAAGYNDTPLDSEVIWADPEYRTEGERADAMVKLHAEGIYPLQIVLEELGKSPQDIRRILALKSQETLLFPPPTPVLAGEIDADE